ncbi:MAG: PD-(D/E)XK nuclease family protein [Anaerolineae bacterium]|nr:PD-(D/E)XK nuclease family protein [Anaerolineae bacterium]
MLFEPITPYQEPPHAALWFGSAGCGKTKAVIGEILALRALSPFRPIWVLLASGAQVTAFRQRMLRASSGEGVLFGVEFFNFEALYHRLLDRAGDPQRAIGRAAGTQALRRVIERLCDEGALELFGPIARTPGFVALAARLVGELKQALVTPEAYTGAASQLGPKDRDLARIYAAYQAFLQSYRLVDGHGAGWVALGHVRGGAAPTSDVQLLAIDGFDQFNRLHVELLTALARQTERTVLTLTQLDDQRAPRFRRFAQTRKRLVDAGQDLWQIVPLTGEGCGRAAPLQHLIDSLLALAPQAAPAGDTLALIEAPDVEREVRAVLRRVKRRLLDGTPPDAILIAARDLALYSGALRETAHAYGIPLVVRGGLPLRDNPAVAAFLALIDLAARDFPRRDTLDVLSSPYLAPPGLDPASVAALARISVERQVIGGRQEWLDAVRSAAHPLVDEDGEPQDEPAISSAALEAALVAWFERITPPAAGRLDDLLGWIEALAGPDPAAGREAIAAAEDAPFTLAARDHVNLIGQVRAAPDGEQATRDLIALQELWQVLAGLRAAHALVDGASSLALRWPDFRPELELALAQATITPPGGASRLGRVLVTDVHEARGLPHDHIYLLGLAEGIFPAPQAQADVHHEGERRALAACGVDLPAPAERADDLSLFYQVIGLARRTLTLSRFTVDDKGAPVPPSPFWSAVLAALDVPPGARERIPVGAAPELDHAATPVEAAVAVSTRLASVSGDMHAALAAHNALLDDSAWRNALRGRRLEARREDARSPFDCHAGLLGDPALIARAAQVLGPDRTWSASQLNDYGMCPFRFFARRLLGLEAVKEPEEGHDALQLGSINHAILERTYRAIQREGLTIALENLPRAQTLLGEAAQAVFDNAPTEYGFRASPVWQREQETLLRRLRWLVEQDFGAGIPNDKNKTLEAWLDGPRVPYALEASFGMGDAAPVEIDGEAGTLRLRGKIDRLDRVGDAIIVIDYKSGSGSFKADDLREGRSVQMLVYLRAAQRLLAGRGETARVVGGAYWHIGSRAISGAVTAADAALDDAEARLHSHVMAARAGRFVVRPSKPMAQGRCAFPCDFSEMCHLSRAGQRRSLPGEDA